MDRLPHKKGRYEQKSHGGCLGIMADIFYLKNGANGKKRLTDEPHCHASSLPSDQAALAGIQKANCRDNMEEKVMMTVSNKNCHIKKPNGMQKTEAANSGTGKKQSPPNVVAKLMGLESLPHPQTLPHVEPRVHKCLPTGPSQQSSCHLWSPLPEKEETTRDVLSAMEPQSRDAGNLKMDVVSRKFSDAKSLAMDEKGRRSKEFRDALDILSSNKDLFLTLLHERNSLVSRRLYDMQSVPQMVKRITVLKPSRAVRNHGLEGLRNPMSMHEKSHSGQFQAKRRDNVRFPSPPSFSPQRSNESPAPRTRIIVLKPNPEMTREAESTASCVSSPSRLYDDDDSDAKLGTHWTCESMENNGMSNRMETATPLDLNDQTADGGSILGISDAEAALSTSGNSSEDIIREAKRRLSERWAMMASNTSSQEHINGGRRSSTLGEMLELSDLNKPAIADVSVPKEQEPRASTSCLNCSVGDEDNRDSFPNLLRSRSLPGSAFSCGGSPNFGFDSGKTNVNREALKLKGLKSSIKGKVSSLIFPWNKKSNPELSEGSYLKDESESSASETLGSSSIPSEANIINEVEIHATKTKNNGYAAENRDQPSPVSVLEFSLDDEDPSTSEPSTDNMKVASAGRKPSKFDVIGRSPPIESVSRTLSWDEPTPCADAAAARPLGASAIPHEEEDRDWLLFVQTLLSNMGHLQWHSPESPMDLSIRARYSTPDENEFPPELKTSQWRSTRKLLFDCVNTALAELSYCKGLMMNTEPQMLLDRVWARIKAWRSLKMRCTLSDGGNGCDMAEIDRVARSEVAGRTLVEDTRPEVDNVGMLIGGRLLEELVEEAVVDVTCAAR